jgi:hypothetical protein
MGRALITFLVYGVVVYAVTKLLFDLPSSRIQRRMRLWVLGSAATALSVGVLWTAVYIVTSHEARQWLGRDIWWVGLLLGGFAVIGGCIWVEVWRAFKKSASDDGKG